LINLFFNILISYLIGSLSGSLILGRFKGIDIRKMGSGNAGGTNAFRTQGFLFALGVIIFDVLKGFVSAKFISTLKLFNLGISLNINSELGILICGMSAVLGHVYPIFHKFKGGKGAGAAIGMLLCLHPISVVFAVLIWTIVLILTGFVGLGTIIGGSSIPIYLFITGESSEFIYFPIISIILALFIFFTHRTNIQRMLKGTENQFEKAMLLKKYLK